MPQSLTKLHICICVCMYLGMSVAYVTKLVACHIIRWCGAVDMAACRCSISVPTESAPSICRLRSLSVQRVCCRLATVATASYVTTIASAIARSWTQLPIFGGDVPRPHAHPLGMPCLATCHNFRSFHEVKRVGRREISRSAAAAWRKNTVDNKIKAHWKSKQPERSHTNTHTYIAKAATCGAVSATWHFGALHIEFNDFYFNCSLRFQTCTVLVCISISCVFFYYLFVTATLCASFAWSTIYSRESCWILRYKTLMNRKPKQAFAINVPHSPLFGLIFCLHTILTRTNTTR